MRSATQDTLRGTRQIFGAISSAGGVFDPGSGDWMVNKTGTGIYVIRFVPIFRSRPNIVISAWFLGWPYIVTSDANQMQINLYNAAQTLVDQTFTFRAEGR